MSQTMTIQNGAIENLETIAVSMRDTISQLIASLDVLEEGLQQLRDQSLTTGDENDHDEDDDSEDSEVELKISQKTTQAQALTEMKPIAKKPIKKSAVDIAIEKGKNKVKEVLNNDDDDDEEVETDLDEEETEPQIPTQTSTTTDTNATSSKANKDPVYESEVNKMPAGSASTSSSSSSSSGQRGGVNFASDKKSTAERKKATGMKERIALKRSSKDQQSSAHTVGLVATDTTSGPVAQLNESDEQPFQKKQRKSRKNQGGGGLPTIVDTEGETSASGGGGGSEAGTWLCPRCTYNDNLDTDNMCAMCDSTRPAITSRPSRNIKSPVPSRNSKK
jgi:hypothetical protein